MIGCDLDKLLQTDVQVPNKCVDFLGVSVVAVQDNRQSANDGVFEVSPFEDCE